MVESPIGSRASGVYFEYLGARIKTELTDAKNLNGREWSEALSVSSCIYINRELGNVTSEQAEELYQRIFTLFPHLEEKLRKEREQGFRPPVLECRHEIRVNIQAPAENQKIRLIPVDLEDLALEGRLDA